MLILSRRESERVYLGDDIVLTIVRVNGDKVRIGVEAPSNVKILRTELEIATNKSDVVDGTPEVRRKAA
ncbi:MAG: carbon storage regulator [Pirellula sp.]|jgi:carbon storage regulator